MLEPFRSDFNSRFTPEKYQSLLRRLDNSTRSTIGFRICETPCFLPKALIDELGAIGASLTHQLVGNPEYMAASAGAVPDQYRVPNESPHPHFMTADFGLTHDASGEITPKLVELQAFPSIFGYQSVACEAYIDTYGLSKNLDWLQSSISEVHYWNLLRTVILGRHQPENVILAEIEPESQKTLPDFHVYEDKLGIATVDIATLKKEGRRLFYQKNRNSGPWIPVHRIFNRAIVDELVRKHVQLNFDYRDDLDVEWAGHPNWYFRISKFSLPFLDHPSVPRTIFLNDWFDRGPASLPLDRNNIILKPLYSFAGRGIQFAPTDEDLASIPVSERSLYLLQERIRFDPVIDTPFGMTQAEIRIMYLWPDGGELQPTINLVRMGRGLMMGVDHNKDQQWVGGSAGLFLAT
ncbi:ATP-grasp domain-containing protein [Granulicella arctica]|uniref:hypothetical protein n=1 Tax=Granulicella arctica TaxID=940613 RepID=UPI0021E08DB9|nr:hypothetical protein [Granulicella arctica]